MGTVGEGDGGTNWEHSIDIHTAAKSLQSCPTLCNPRDSSPPGSPVPGILQARTLEWVAISFSLPCIKEIASGKLLYSMGSSAQCSVMTERVGGRLSEKGHMYTYSRFTRAVQQRPSQSCKAITLHK